MKSYRKMILLAASGVAALTLAGCSFSCSVGEKTVSSDELNGQLTDSYENETGLTLTDVDCKSVKAEVGEAINCTGTNERDIEVDILGKVTSVDEGDDSIKYDWNVVSASAPGELYSSAAKKTLEQQSGQALNAVTCPERVPIERGSQVSCQVETADGEKLDATLTLTNLDGGFRINVDEAGSAPADTSGA